MLAFITEDYQGQGLQFARGVFGWQTRATWSAKIIADGRYVLQGKQNGSIRAAGNMGSHLSKRTQDGTETYCRLKARRSGNGTIS